MFEEFADSLVAVHALLRELGCAIEYCPPNVESEQRAMRLGKSLITSNAQIGANDFLYGRAAWVFLTDAGGDDVACQFLRCEDIGDERLEQYLARSYSRQYRADVRCADGLPKLSGTSVYFGELFARPGAMAGPAAFKRIWAMVSHALHHSHYHWRFDFCYAFVRDRDACRGALTRYGFTSQWISPLLWVEGPSYRSDTEYLITTSESDFLYNCRNHRKIIQATMGQQESSNL